LILLALPGSFYELVFNSLTLIGVIVIFKHYRYDLDVFSSEWAVIKNFHTS